MEKWIPPNNQYESTMLINPSLINPSLDNYHWTNPPILLPDIQLEPLLEKKKTYAGQSLIVRTSGYHQRIITLRTHDIIYLCKYLLYHICSCPCKRSHLEPLCLHTYIHKYTGIIMYDLKRYFCTWTQVVGAQTCVCPCEPSHLEHRIWTCGVHVRLYAAISCFHVRESVLFWHGTLTLRTSLYTLKYSQIYIYRMIDTFVYELKFCEFTYVFALASAHFEALCIQAHIYKYYIYIYISVIA